jgi:hypothetical protein
MSGFSFTEAEVNNFREKYPEAWYFINTLRLERENKELTKNNIELQTKLHSLGPQPEK